MGIRLLLYPVKKKLKLLPGTVFEKRQKFIAAVTPHEAEIQGGQAENVGKIPNQDIPLHMAVSAVDIPKIRQVEHDAAHVVGQRLIQITVNQRVAAEAVGNAGHRIGMDHMVELPVILFIGR